MKKIFEQVLQEITPTEEEKKEVYALIDDFLKRLRKVLRDEKVILGGSMAKGTWLKGVYDADLFIQFPYKKYQKKSDILSDILEPKLRKKFGRVTRLHGSRDYFQIKENNITYEIIPILRITKAEQAMNITDISPLHAKWVKKNAKHIDEIRLVKAFAKAQGVYGAESYIRGFSGYVLEILTVYYGTFRRLINAAAKWEPKTIIDIKRYHRNVMFEVNQSKLVSPLILIDPVQAGRNTAASLSYDNDKRLVAAAQAFLENPSAEFFVKKEITKDDLKKRAGNNNVLFFSVQSKRGKEDVIGGKLLKAFTFFTRKLKSNEFKVLDKGWEYDKKQHAIFWFIVSPAELPAERRWVGPPLRKKSHVEVFKKKYKTTYVRGRRIFAFIKRKYRTPESLVKGEANNSYLKDKVKAIEWNTSK